MHVEDLCKFSSEVPDCIHSLVLSDELNELLDSQTELKTALPKNKTNASKFRPQVSQFFFPQMRQDNYRNSYITADPGI